MGPMPTVKHWALFLTPVVVKKTSHLLLQNVDELITMINNNVHEPTIELKLESQA
jgi:hypothetical protein